MRAEFWILIEFPVNGKEEPRKTKFALFKDNEIILEEKGMSLEGTKVCAVVPVDPKYDKIPVVKSNIEPHPAFLIYQSKLKYTKIVIWKMIQSPKGWHCNSKIFWRIF